MSIGTGWLALVEHQPFDWRILLGLVVLGSAGVWWTWKMFDRRPVVTINAHGIETRMKWIRSIQWQDIQRTELRVIREDWSIIQIYPKDASVWESRMPATYRFVWKHFPRRRYISVSLLNADRSGAKIAASLAAFEVTEPEPPKGPLSVSANPPC
jgi:hypothetical protein